MRCHLLAWLSRRHSHALENQATGCSILLVAVEVRDIVWDRSHGHCGGAAVVAELAVNLPGGKSPASGYAGAFTQLHVPTPYGLHACFSAQCLALPSSKYKTQTRLLALFVSRRPSESKPRDSHAS